ncbi:MAG: hypothetical protein KC414_12690, partial [Romboutsia sp.]|nr:hypothetical protein [Romboutsia sp.]
TAAKKDIFLMRTAGAVEVCDFSDFGYPSTYLLPENELFSLFWNIYNYLNNRCEQGGYIVLEIADGIFQKEAEMLLSNLDVKSSIDYLVFSCCDSLSAVAGIERIENKFGMKVAAISGPAANSQLGLKEIAKFSKDVPAFNNMILDVQTIAETFTCSDYKKESVHVLPEAIVEEETLNTNLSKSD